MAERGLLAMLRRNLSSEDEDLSPDVARTARAARQSRGGLGDILMGAARGYAAGAQSDIPEVGAAQGLAGGFETARGLAEQRRLAGNRVRIPKRQFGLEEDGEFEFETGKDAAAALAATRDKGLSFEERMALLEATLRGKKEIEESKSKRGRPLPAGEADKMAQVGVLKDLLGEVKTSYFGAEPLKPGQRPPGAAYVGPMEARLGRASQTFGPGATTQKSNFYQNISAIRNQILNLRSGAAISAQEASRLIQELPQETRSDVDFEASMNNFEKTLNTILENKKKSFAAVGFNVNEIDTGNRESEDDLSDIQKYLE